MRQPGRGRTMRFGGLRVLNTYANRFTIPHFILFASLCSAHVVRKVESNIFALSGGQRRLIAAYLSTRRRRLGGIDLLLWRPCSVAAAAALLQQTTRQRDQHNSPFQFNHRYWYLANVFNAAHTQKKRTNESIESCLSCSNLPPVFFLTAVSKLFLRERAECSSSSSLLPTKTTHQTPSVCVGGMRMARSTYWIKIAQLILYTLFYYPVRLCACIHNV